MSPSATTKQSGFRKYQFLLLSTYVLYAIAIYIYSNFPALNQYFYGADEGTYFRQALQVKVEGFSGFKILCDEFVQNANQEQLFPNPLRVGHILLATIAVSFNVSIQSLSFLSLFFFILLNTTLFIFLKKWFDEKTATIMSCIVTVSPLLCSLSGRALSDVDSCFFHILVLFTFIQYIQSPSNKRFIYFISALVLNILVKETGGFLIPFYTLTLLYYRYSQKKSAILNWHIIGSVVLPVLISGLIVMLLVGDFSSIIAIVKVLIRNNVSSNTLIDYVKNYNSGPWYLYIINFLLLSPLTILLFLVSITYYLIQSKKHPVISIILLYIAYSLVIYNFLPKNVRYVVQLDVLIRICSIFFLINTLSYIKLPAARKNFGLVAIILILMSYDIINYRKFFVIRKIYDPISYDLLRTEKIIP
ncbi:hypothetical protein [Emticicia fontis]